MLNLKSSRLDYGDQLRAPGGYALHCGIGTTYSLDLDALIAASLALTLDQTLEGELSGERIAFLEALDRLRDRVLVFYQSAQVKVPASYNRLYALLEPLTVPVVSAGGAFSSFHPKVWLLRFVALEANGPDRFRLLVLTRNLSFDRSWDLALAIDGTVATKRTSVAEPLLQFVRSLPAKDQQATVVERLCKDLELVQWDCPDGFDGFALLPGGPRGGPIRHEPFDLTGAVDDLLVVSPFLDAESDSFLQDLSRRTRGNKTLVSRADTLDAIGPEALDGWTCLTVAGAIVDGEERLQRERALRQDLHAKLVIARQGGKTTWHVGSANMTNAAFGSPGKRQAPRNTEFMVKLQGASRRLAPNVMLDDWLATQAFTEHEFSERPTESLYQSVALRRLVHALTEAGWTQRATEQEDGSFMVELTAANLPPTPVGFDVQVSPLARFSPKTLTMKTSWADMHITDVSAFMRIDIASTESEPAHSFAIQTVFDIDLFEARRNAVFKATVDSEEKLLRYLTILLDVDADKEGWTKVDGTGDHDADVFGLSQSAGLYEQLLMAAARAPHRIARAVRVFKRLSDEGVPLPNGLDALFRGFEPYWDQTR